MYYYQVINNKVNKISRYFRRNKGDDDYATIPEVTLAGDFVIECDFYRSDGGVSGQFIFASYDTVTGSYGVNLYTSGDWGNSAGTVQLFSFTGTPAITGLSPKKWYKVRFEYDASTGMAVTYLNGQLFSQGVCTPPNGLDSADISAIYRAAQAGFSFGGIVANLKIWDSGTLIRNYPINDGKNILANAATALGNEIDGLTYALTAAIGGVASVVLTSLSVIGKTYLVVISYVGVIGDAIARIGGFSSPSFTGTGTIEFVATATTTVNDMLGALTGVTSGSVTVSIKEADGYGTIVNGNADDWGLFDRQANGDWLGQELVVNGGFDSDLSGWSVTEPVGQVVEWDNGRLHIITDGTGCGVTQLVTPYESVRSFSLNYTHVAGSLKLQVGSVTYALNETKAYSFEVLPSANSSVFLYRNTGIAEGYFDNVSAKEVLKSA